MPGYLYMLVDRYRTSVQTAIQVIAAGLAAIEVFTICRLINLSTRIWLTRAPFSLNMLGFWSALSTPTNNWNLPFWMVVGNPLLSNQSAVISALWTGALTPANTTSIQNATVLVRDWSNLSLIQEYPSEVDKTGLTIRNTKGYFTYSVGVGMLGSLLSSVNSASPVDGGIRKHAKLDNTGYSYYGRSYGVGASTGLLDDSVDKYFAPPTIATMKLAWTPLSPASTTTARYLKSTISLRQLFSPRRGLYQTAGPPPRSTPST